MTQASSWFCRLTPGVQRASKCLFRQCSKFMLTTLTMMPLVDLELMVFFVRGRKIALFGRRWHKNKKYFKFHKMQKIVEISLASRPWSQPQRHARLSPRALQFCGGRPACHLSTILRWEAPSLLTALFLGGGTLRLAAR
jgi:hypothetical protein